MRASWLAYETPICRENRQIPQGAYSPLTNAYYVPAFNGPCSVMTVNSLEPSIQTGYNTSYLRDEPSPASQLGQPEAIEVTTGKTLWRLERDVRRRRWVTLVWPRRASA